MLASCRSLERLVVCVGHNAAGFGSRIERMKRSLDISNVIRRINDERIRMQVAPFMFGVKDGSLAQDITACLQASWLSRVEGDAAPWD